MVNISVPPPLLIGVHGRRNCRFREQRGLHWLPHPLARLCRSRHARAIKAVASPAVAVRAAAHRRSLALCWRPRRRVRPRGIFLYSAEAEAEAPRVLAAFLASVRGET
jgi:hypothetical protein